MTRKKVVRKMIELKEYFVCSVDTNKVDPSCYAKWVRKVRDKSGHNSSLG